MRLILMSLLLSATATVAATLAAAQDLPSYLIFSLSKEQPRVIATNLVGGFTPQEAQDFIAQNCAGAVSELTPVGQPRKRRGSPRQRYMTTCTGGPAATLPNVEKVAIEIEKLADGRILTEYIYYKGDTLTKEEHFSTP